MSTLSASEGLRAWLQEKLPEVPFDNLDLSDVTTRDETLKRIGTPTENLLLKILRAEHRANPDNLIPTLKGLLTNRTHFRYLEEVLKLANTNSLSEAFSRFVVISPSKEPSKETVVIGSTGQRNKEGYYQVYNRLNPEAGSLFFGRKAFTHLYELFSDEGALKEKETKAREREKGYEVTLKSLLLQDKPRERSEVSKDSWIIKERQEFLAGLRAEVDVARNLLQKLGYVPSGILSLEDKALLENDAGGGTLGWLKRERENLPPHAKEALELLLDKFIDLSDVDRSFLLESVFSVAQAQRYIDKAFSLDDIASDLEAYNLERGSYPPSFLPLQRLVKSNSKIVTHRDLNLIGTSGIIDYRRERNEKFIKDYQSDLIDLMKVLSPLLQDQDGRLFDDVLGRSVPSRLKNHLYFRSLYRGESIISKDDLIAIRDIAQFYKNGEFSWHLATTYSIDAFIKKVERAVLAGRKIQYVNTYLNDIHLSDKPKDPPSATILGFNKELILGEVTLFKKDTQTDELIKRARNRGDLLDRFPDYERKLRALNSGLRMRSFSDEEFNGFKESMNVLKPIAEFLEKLNKVKWITSRPLVDVDVTSDLPPDSALYLSEKEIEAIDAVSKYADIREKLHQSLVDEASKEIEKALIDKKRSYSNAIFVVHRWSKNVSTSKKAFTIENHSIYGLEKGQRYAGLAWQNNVEGISYYDPELLKKSLDRIDEDFVAVLPPYSENSQFQTLKLLVNASGVSRLRAYGFDVDKNIWRTVPGVNGTKPLYISRKSLEFITGTLQESTRAINTHFGVGETGVIFAFGKGYEGKDLLDVATNSPKELKEFLSWMKKNSFPKESCDVVEKALEEDITKEALIQFAFDLGERELKAMPKAS